MQKMEPNVSDIVERLRGYAKDQGRRHNIEDTCEEAADALTASAARIAELEWELSDTSARKTKQYVNMDAVCEAATARAERREAALKHYACDCAVNQCEVKD